jgi:hypothetical protein
VESGDEEITKNGSSKVTSDYGGVSSSLTATSNFCTPSSGEAEYPEGSEGCCLCVSGMLV